MTFRKWSAFLCVSLALGGAGGMAWGADPGPEPRPEALTESSEQHLASIAEDAPAVEDLLPFTRNLGVSGIVSGSLAQSAEAAGVPAAALPEALRALGTTVDLDREVHDGDRFYVRFEKQFTIRNEPTGAGRVLWLEVQLAKKRTAAIHRFKPKVGFEGFYTANGQATGAPPIRLPVDVVVVSSGFGLRVDPMDQPAMRGMGMGPMRGPALPPALSAGTMLHDVNVATPLGLAMGLTPNAGAAFAGPRRMGPMAMHEGVDLVAPPGTSIHAAADGIVKGAEPKGRYGNWVEIEHEGKLSTVYGHLSAFAPGIKAGTRVRQGDVIGYVGTTGRTTGPHVHFELLANGRPVNPIVHSAVRRMHLLGPDLVAFRKSVQRDQAERNREQ